MDPNTDGFGAVLQRRARPRHTRIGADTFLDPALRVGEQKSDVAELFHENTKLNEPLGRKVGHSKRALDAHPATKLLQLHVDQDYPASQAIELPPPSSVDVSLGEVLQERRSVDEFAADGLTLDELSTLLSNACGTTYARPVQTETFKTVRTFRAYPSAGALYPVEIHLLVQHSPDLEPGIYYYNPNQHVLRAVDDWDPENLDQVLLDPIASQPLSVLVALTGAFTRTKIKYGPRSYRYVQQEAGHIGQNLQLVGTGMGLGTIPLASFHDDRLNERLGINGVDEGVVYTMALGHPDEAE